MSITIPEAAELARQRLKLPPNEGPRLETLVPKALQDLAERIAPDPFKRRYTYTDPTVVTAGLGGDGSADLASLSDANGLLLECLDYGEITHPDSQFPLKPRSGSGQGKLPGNYDRMFLHYYMVGTRIFTISLDSNITPLVGNLAFACPHVSTIDTLAVQLEDDLIDQIILLERSGTEAPQQVTAQ